MMGDTVVAMVLAGGSGSRLGAEVNKVYLPIAGRPMLASVLETFDRSDLVSEIIVVGRPSDRDAARALLAERTSPKPIRLIDGGASRHGSEMAGLAAIRAQVTSGGVSLVAIHDGARPFLTTDLLDRVLKAGIRYGGAIPGLAIDDPLYHRSGGHLTPMDVGALRRVQTPQAFWARPLLAAFDASHIDRYEGVDTAATVERFTDLEIRVVPGDRRNIKVTYGDDVATAERYGALWCKGAWTGES